MRELTLEQLQRIARAGKKHLIVVSQEVFDDCCGARGVAQAPIKGGYEDTHDGDKNSDIFKKRE